MKTVISAVFVLTCVFSLDAQITALLKPLPDGSNEVRIRNDAASNLEAFAIRTNRANVIEFERGKRPHMSDDAPDTEYVDAMIDAEPTRLAPSEERVVERGGVFEWQGQKVVLTHTLPIVTAGIFADGTTSGDPELLRRLILRRCNMLQAVETTLDIISDAGRRNMPRDVLVSQFRKMADSLNRWYVPLEQRVGHDLYQSMMGKLLNLPEEPVGTPFPPDSFVVQETAMLNRQRVELLESQPGLSEAAVIHR